MLLLTSLERVRAYIELENTVKNNRILTNFIASVSSNIQSFLDRDLTLQEYTEYYNVDNIRSEYQIKNFPVTEIASVTSDVTGLYDGSQSSQTKFYIGVSARSVALDFPVFGARKGLKVTYTGGLAISPTRSVFAITSSGTWIAGNYVTGSTSGAVGIIKSITQAVPTSITLEVLYGIFSVGESLTSQTSEGSPNLAGVTATINTITSRSLVEIAPEIAQACEMQIRYNWKHKDDFENAGVNKDGTAFSKLSKNLDYADIYQLRPEVRGMLVKHRNIYIG